MVPDVDDTFQADEDTAAEMEARKRGPRSQDITAALMSSEPDVDLPGRGRPASVISNTLALKPGETFTKSVAVPDDCTIADMKKNMLAWKSELRSSINNSLREARKVDGYKFSTETALCITPSGAVYIQVITTRIE